MEPVIKDLEDSFKIGYEAYKDSRDEAEEMFELYHNRQYNQAQINELMERGQPVETFNIVKAFSRLMLGYYGTVVNAIQITPRQQEDEPVANVMEDTVKFVLEDNMFETEVDKIKLDALLGGIMCCFLDVIDTGEVDEFKRPIRKIVLRHVPIHELVIDPMSSQEDYSDARYIHRFKWVTDDFIKKTWGASALSDLDGKEHESFLNIDEAEFDYVHGGPYAGYYKHDKNYLIVHSIVVEMGEKKEKGTDVPDKVWSIFWVKDKILEKKEITYQKVRFPYRVQRLNTSNKNEYYGIFREVKETQKAINQALLKIQLMANTEKVVYQKGAIENREEFIRQYNRVNSLAEVMKLENVKFVDQTKEVAEQYAIIDRGLDRIKQVLGINDSFLGQAFAADSGRKVKLQQNATLLSLRYVSSRFEQFYRLLGWDIVNLIKQYYSAHQILRTTDERNQHRFTEINKPIQHPQDGRPIMEEHIGPDGKPEVDDEGNIIIAPIPQFESDIQFARVDLSIDATVMSEQDEKNQILVEAFLHGPPGQMLQQVSPSDYFYLCSLVSHNFKTRFAREMSLIFKANAQKLGQLEGMGIDPNMLLAMYQGGQGGGQTTGGAQPKQLPNRQMEPST